MIDATTGEHYPLGMLIAKLKRYHKSGKHVYQGIVLSQALKDIEHKYRGILKNLRPLEREDSSKIKRISQLTANKCEGLLRESSNLAPVHKVSSINIGSDKSCSIKEPMSSEVKGDVVRPTKPRSFETAKTVRESSNVVESGFSESITLQ